MTAVPELHWTVRVWPGGIRVVLEDWTEVEAVVDELFYDAAEWEDWGPESPGRGDWNEGHLAVHWYSHDPPEDWDNGYFQLTSLTKEGDWDEVAIARSTGEGESHFDEVVEPGAVEIVEAIPRDEVAGVGGSESDEGSVEEATKVGESYNDVMAVEPTDDADLQSLESYHRERAENAGEAVRPKSLKRLLVADEIVRYANDEESESEVWDEYVSERGESVFPPGVDEFIRSPQDGGYLGVSRFRRLCVEDVGPEIFGEEEVEELFAVGDRALRDTLLTLRHFHCE